MKNIIAISADDLKRALALKENYGFTATFLGRVSEDAPEERLSALIRRTRTGIEIADVQPLDRPAPTPQQPIAREPDPEERKDVPVSVARRAPAPPFVAKPKPTTPPPPAKEPTPPIGDAGTSGETTVDTTKPIE
jgi:hypothetical protein